MLNSRDQAEGLRRILMSAKLSAINDLGLDLQQGKGQFLHTLIEDMERRHVEFIDTSIGNAQELPLALLNCHDFVLKLSYRPESIKQAFGIIKLLSKSAEKRVFGIIISAQDQSTAHTIFRNIKQASKGFPHIRLEMIGFSTLSSNWVNPVLPIALTTHTNETFFTTPYGVATN